jgi:hypothetical protein
MVARRAGMTSSGVARLLGKPERGNETAKLASTSVLPRTSERRRRLKTAKDESGRLKVGRNLKSFYETLGFRGRRALPGLLVW